MLRLSYPLLVVALTGLVLWQLVTGIALDRRWRPSVNRQDNPGMYWFVVLAQSAILVYVLITGKTTIGSEPGQKDQGRSAQAQNTADVPARTKESRDRAFDLYRAQKWTEAVAAFDELLLESDEDAEVHYWRGMAQWRLGHDDQALQDFRRVIELEPTNFEANRSADRILSRQQHWDEVLAIWDGYIARVPTNAEAYFERGGTNFHKGDLAAAQADAARACELGKSDACALLERLRSKP